MPVVKHPTSDDGTKRVPLRFVQFIHPTPIEGCAIPMLTVQAMETRLVAGVEFVCPQPYLDRETNRIVIGSREYPMDRVNYFERAHMARSVPKPLPLDLEKYTEGPRRIIVTVPGKAKS